MSARIFASDPGDEVDSFEAFRRIIDGLNGPRFFRGCRRASHELLPSAGRLQTFGGAPEQRLGEYRERDLFHRFRRYTYQHVGRILNEWETLFYARHHQLPVRLLDWSTNPLVALYFACENHDDKCVLGEDGAIWVFEREEGDHVRNHVNVFRDQDPFVIKGVRLVYPFYPDERMTAQSGVFTIHEHPDKDLSHLTTNEYPQNDMDIKAGYKCLVKAEAKPRILKLLDRMGISRRTLYPDLDGLAFGLVHSEMLKD